MMETQQIARAVLSVFSGLLYGSAWWLFIDAFWAMGGDALSWYHFCPLLLGALGTIVVFGAPRRAILGKASDGFYGDGGISMKVKRVSFFAGLMLLILSIFLAVLLCVLQYNDGGGLAQDARLSVNKNTPLIIMVVSTVLAAFSVFLYKFARPMSASSDF